MLVERLSKEWLAGKAARPIRDVPGFASEGLVLGAGAILVKAGHDSRAMDLKEEARLKALLSVAYRRPIPREALGHLKAAAARWNAGDKGRAGLHLALSRLGRLEQPAEAARRLFMADGLMRAGVTPEAILGALDLEPSTTGGLALKYSQDQPRVPAGNGRPSGEWTASGEGTASLGPQKHPIRHTEHRPVLSNRRRQTGHAARPANSAAHAAAVSGAPASSGGSRPSPTHSFLDVAVGAASGRSITGLDLGRMTEPALSGLATFITGLAESGAFAASVAATGAVAVLGVLFVPSTGPRGKWVNIGGPGNVSYYQNPDESEIRFKYTTSEGAQRTWAALPDPDGNFRGPNGRVIARWVKGGARIGLVISTAALVGHDTDRTDLCPVVSPDKKHGNSRALGYENYVKKWVNSENPTPSGMGYSRWNPVEGKAVAYDDCHHPTGTLIDAKGLGYAKNILKKNGPGEGMRAKLLRQSKEQLEASGGKPIVWFFAEKAAADEVRKLFREEDDGLRKRIRIVWLPWVEGMK